MGMKAKTIKLVLNNKLEKWFDSINNEFIRNTAKANTIVTGGAIASMLLGEKVNDYDIYFKEKEDLALIAQYYIDRFNHEKSNRPNSVLNSINPELRKEKITNFLGETEERVVIRIQSAGVAGDNQSEYQYFEQTGEDSGDSFLEESFAETLGEVEEVVEDLKEKKTKFRPVYMTDNAITLSDKIQLVLRFYGTAKEIHRNYDFVHCTSYYDYSTKHLELPKDALESLLSKSLIYTGSLYPLASMFRIRKFLDRGWRISAGQMLKIAEQISRINFNDHAMLREQLIGVDAAYMHQLIAALQNHQGKIDSTYLATLIDKIFED